MKKCSIINAQFSSSGKTTELLIRHGGQEDTGRNYFDGNGKRHYGSLGRVVTRYQQQITHYREHISCYQLLIARYRKDISRCQQRIACYQMLVTLRQQYITRYRK